MGIVTDAGILYFMHHHKSKIEFSFFFKKNWRQMFWVFMFRFDTFHWKHTQKNIVLWTLYIIYLPNDWFMWTEPFLYLIFYFVNKQIDFQQVEILVDLRKTWWEVFQEDKKKRDKKITKAAINRFSFEHTFYLEQWRIIKKNWF